MLIDWFTVAAQIINFVILVWLLKRFLYQPILRAIDAREEKVKTQIQEAETKEADAERERDEFRRKNEEFEAERESMLNEAEEDAREKRRALLEEAREEARDLRERLEKAIREEKADLYREVVERTQREVFNLTRKVLRELASQSLEEHMSKNFLRRLQGLEGDKRRQLAEALNEAPQEVTVKSAFELPDTQQKDIESALAEVASEKIDCRFVTEPEKIGGIELTAGGYKMAWSVDDYLSTLEKKVGALLSSNGELTGEAPEREKAASDGSD